MNANVIKMSLVLKEGVRAGPRFRNNIDETLLKIQEFNLKPRKGKRGRATVTSCLEILEIIPCRRVGSQCSSQIIGREMSTHHKDGF